MVSQRHQPAQLYQMPMIQQLKPNVHKVELLTQNPGSAKVVSGIEVKTFTSTTQLDSGTGSVTFTPKILPKSWGRVESQVPTVGVYANLIVTLTVTIPVPTDGKILITIPKWDTESSQSMTEQLTSCSAGEDINGNTPLCSVNKGSSNDIITVTNAFTILSQLDSGKTLQITLSKIQNPPTLKVYSSFEIYTADNQGNLIEKCSGLSLILQNAGNLNSQSQVTIDSNPTVNSVGTYQFFIKLGNPIPSNGWIRIAFPPEVTLLNTYTFTALVQISQSATLTSSTLTINGKQMQILDIKNGIQTYITEDSAILFKISGIQNPTSTERSSSFGIYTFDEDNNGIDQMISGLTVQASQGQLKNVKIIADKYGVLEKAKSFNISFQTTNTIDALSSIVLVFPIDFIVSQRTCSVTGSYNQSPISQTATCGTNSGTNSITVKSFSSTSLTGGTTISLQITNLQVRIPPSVKTLYYLEIYTASSTGGKVDYDKSTTFSPTSSGFTSASIVPNSYQTNQQDVAYTFTLVPSGYLFQYSTILIVLPSEIVVSNSQMLTNYCEKVQGFKTAISCKQKEDNQIIISNGFTQSISEDPPTLVFKVNGLKNPRSMGVTESFQVFILEGNDSKYVLYNKTTGIQVQMNETSSLAKIEIIRGSQINGAVTNYTWKIQLNNELANGDFFMIESPQGNIVTFSNSTKCQGISANLYYDLSCSLTDIKTLKIVMKTRFLRSYLRNLQTVSKSQANFIVTNVRNPISLKPTGSFTITQFSSLGDNIESLSTGVIVQNNQSSTIDEIVITPQSYQTGVSTQYQFNANLNHLVEGMIVSIIILKELQISSKVTCNYQCNFNQFNRTLTIKGIQNSQFKITVQNITNPMSQMIVQGFQISTYTSDWYLIEESRMNLSLDFQCSQPCKTCEINNNTACASCSQAEFLFDKQCFQECPLSTYMSGNNCLSCSKYCIKCNDKYQCTQCNEGYQLNSGSCTTTSKEIKDGAYYYPFTVLMLIWLLASVFITVHWQRTWFLTTCLIGLSVLEHLLLIIELAVLRLTILLIIGLLSTYIFNLTLLLMYYLHLKKHFLDYDSIYRTYRVTIITVSLIFSSRIFKLFYSNLGHRAYLSLSLTSIPYKLLSLLSLLPSVLLIINAFTSSLNIDRIILSSITVLLGILEIIYWDKERPQIIQKLINKFGGKEQQQNTAEDFQKQDYNELPNQSIATQPLENGPSTNSEDQIRRQIIEQILERFKDVNSLDLEQTIIEALGKQERKKKVDKQLDTIDIDNIEKQKIQDEWEAIKREKEELNQLRKEIEEERKEFEMPVMQEELQRFRLESPRIQSEKLEEIPTTKNNLNTARGRRIQPLDSVRESQSELHQDEDRRHSKKHQTLSKGSRKSNQSETSSKKCHGHSHVTLQSISKLRKRNSQSQYKDDFTLDMFQSPRNNNPPCKSQESNNRHDDGGSNHKWNNTSGIQGNAAQENHREAMNKIFNYSRKQSGSSVEEPLEDTPSNYNILNGRFESTNLKRTRLNNQSKPNDSSYPLSNQRSSSVLQRHFGNRLITDPVLSEQRNKNSRSNPRLPLAPTTTTMMRPINGDKIKALEVAYLTRLNKMAPISHTQPINYLQRINSNYNLRSENSEEEFNLSGLTRTRFIAPQINNFNEL